MDLKLAMNLHYSMKWERKRLLNGSLPSVPTGRKGVALWGSLEPESQSPVQERPGERRPQSGQGPREHPLCHQRRTPQGRAGSAHSRSQAPGSRQRAPLCRGKTHGYLGRGAGPSSVRCRCAGLGPVRDAASERHCRPSAPCLGHPHTGLMHFSPPLPGSPTSPSFPQMRKMTRREAYQPAPGHTAREKQS